MTFWGWLFGRGEVDPTYSDVHWQQFPTFLAGLIAIGVMMLVRFALSAVWSLVAIYAICILGCFGLLLWFRRGPSYRQRSLVFHGLMVVLCLFVSYQALVLGQSKAPIVWTFALLPLPTAFFLCPRACLMWAGISWLSGVLVMGSEAIWPVTPVITQKVQYSVLMFSSVLGVVLVSCLSFLFVLERHISLLVKREEKSQQQTQEALRMSRELLAARDEALAAAQSKSVFLANMSHEIRTPLNGVIGAASLLIDSALELQQRNLVQTIQKSGELLLGIINDILDLSKLEAGHVTLEQQVFPVRECVEDVLDLFAQVAWEKGIDLAYRMDHDVHPRIKADAFRLQQVLINLVGNAVKFTSTGEVVVEIQQQRPGMLLINVRDTGIGIPEAEQHKLFRQFHQVDPSTTRRFGGTGLGLAICKHLISLMGGELSVRSEVNVGSTFSFTFNVEPVALTEDDREDFSLLTNKRLLILEPQNTTRLCMAANANVWGMQVMTTGSWQEAETWLKEQEHKFDVVLLSSSLQSPEDFACQVSQLLPQTPIVCITSLADAYSRSSREDSLFSGVLLKPLRRSQMLNVLTTVFSGGALEIRTRQTPQRKNWGEEMPLRILVAEDNSINQQVVLQILERLGYAPVVVSHGLEVLEALEHASYEMLLLDMQMPHMDGPTTAREIRKRWPREERPYIVALTANVMREQRERFEEAGIDDFLGKPIQVEDLMRVLEHYAQHSHRRKASTLRNTSGHVSRSSFRTPARLAVVRASVTSAATMQILSREPVEQLLELCEQGDILLDELVESHIQNSKELLQQMQQAARDTNASGLELAAHSLKSTSAMFGGDMVSTLCQQLEHAAQENLWDVAATLIPKLEMALSMTHHALQAFINNVEPSIRKGKG